MATPQTNFFDPGATSVFVPAATSMLQVEFSRNPASFALSKYMQIVPGSAMAGLYPELSSSDPVTVVTQEDNLWADGVERPVGRKRPMRWKRWTAERRTYAFTLGGLTVDQARFDIVGSHARGEAARAMTDRTLDAVTILETAANWATANQAISIDALLGTTAACAWSGALATRANQCIKRGFNKIKQTVAQQTGGVVTADQLMMVINPVTADLMARSDEIREYLVNHDAALAVLRGNERRVLDDWGMPPVLYGIEVVIEDAVRQTSRREIDGSGTIGYCMADNKAVFISRIGGLVAPAPANQTNAAPSFTTLTGFFHEEMNVETETDTWNRLVKGAVTDTRDIVITANNSGFLVEDITT